MLRTAYGEGLSKMGTDRGERAYCERKLAKKIVRILGAKRVFSFNLESRPERTASCDAIHFQENAFPHAI